MWVITAGPPYHAQGLLLWSSTLHLKSKLKTYVNVRCFVMYCVLTFLTKVSIIVTMATTATRCCVESASIFTCYCTSVSNCMGWEHNKKYQIIHVKDIVVLSNLAHSLHYGRKSVAAGRAYKHICMTISWQEACGHW